MSLDATWEDRRGAGRALRELVPRSAHADWTPAPTRGDVVQVLETQAESRLPELVPIRYARMAESPFAFYRGAAAVMAMDLAPSPSTGLRVQACGDAHVANFGQFASPGRNLVFDVNDFDETLSGPWEWDVKRLAGSLQVVACQREFSPAACEQIVGTSVRAYREHMAEAATKRTLDRWYARTNADDVIAHFPAKYRPQVRRDVEKARRKDHRRAVAKLTDDIGIGVRFAEDPPLVVHLDNTDQSIDDVAPMVDGYRSSLTHELQQLFDQFRIVDVARKVVGVGSVGTRCWICLFEGPDRPNGDHLVLQVKEAQASVLEPYVGPSTLGHHGRRVVEGQRLTQAASDIFLGWTESPRTGRQYYVRQLWDFKGSSDPMTMDQNNLAYYGALCAMTLARAHARSGDPVPIAGYLGSGKAFDRAVVEWAAKYERTNRADHAELVDAIASGRIGTA